MCFEIIIIKIDLKSIEDDSIWKNSFSLLEFNLQTIKYYFQNSNVTEVPDTSKLEVISGKNEKIEVIYGHSSVVFAISTMKKDDVFFWKTLSK